MHRQTEDLCTSGDDVRIIPSRRTDTHKHARRILPGPASGTKLLEITTLGNRPFFVGGVDNGVAQTSLVIHMHQTTPKTTPRPHPVGSPASGSTTPSYGMGLIKRAAQYHKDSRGFETCIERQKVVYKVTPTGGPIESWRGQDIAKFR
jgi:hypothetical protein